MIFFALSPNYLIIYSVLRTYRDIFGIKTTPLSNFERSCIFKDQYINFPLKLHSYQYLVSLKVVLLYQTNSLLMFLCLFKLSFVNDLDVGKI